MKVKRRIEVFCLSKKRLIKLVSILSFLYVSCKKIDQSIYFTNFDMFELKGDNKISTRTPTDYILFKQYSDNCFAITHYNQTDVIPIEQLFFRDTAQSPIFTSQLFIKSTFSTELQGSYYSPKRFTNKQAKLYKDYLNVLEKEMIRYVYAFDSNTEKFELLEMSVRTPSQCNIYRVFLPVYTNIALDYKNSNKIMQTAKYKETISYFCANDTLTVNTNKSYTNKLINTDLSVFVKPQTGTWFLQWAGVPDTVLAVKVR